MYNSNTKYVCNRLALRPPQAESLERFARLCDILSLSKKPDLEEELVKVRELYPTLTSFERKFPSICFALATGIGKTRLMGAIIAYLVYQKYLIQTTGA
jgi:type III restriction enzyme